MVSTAPPRHPGIFVVVTVGLLVGFDPRKYPGTILRDLSLCRLQNLANLYSCVKAELGEHLSKATLTAR